MLCETLPRLEADEYPGGLWYYEPHTYQPYRYVLGRVGRRPLVCIGINPSTAQPGALDPTLKSVERLANANGFDSWIMFNVYPQRATNPNDMDKTPDRTLCDENLRWLQAVLAQTEPTMWAAASRSGTSLRVSTARTSRRCSTRTARSSIRNRTTS